jgi:biopolymer transport protein ExbD
MSTKRVVDEMSANEMKLELTPMIDVSFLLIIFFICLPFKTLAGKLAAFLPTDKGINPTPQEPLAEIKVQVHLLARKEEARQWGPKDAQQSITMPTQIVYKVNDRETENLNEVYRMIVDAKRQAEGSENTRVLGEIKAGHKTPHMYIVAVLNKFAEAGMEKVDFYGTQIPPPELRRMELLPYPKKNYQTAD